MRLHFTLALITAIMLAVTLHTANQHHFSFAEVEKLAQNRVARKYVSPPATLPPQLANLTPQQEAGIFWKDAFRLWRRNGLPFQVDFYHISQAFPTGPRINTVDRKGAHPLAYSPTFFDFSGLTFNPPLPTTLPYAGFYLRYPLPTATEPKPNILNGFFTTQGSSYFRMFAADQVYGLSARAIAIDTGVSGKPEEFPQFTDWWLYQPTANATELVLDALVESPSLVGAYEFKIHPGSVSSLDVHATLFFRQSVSRLGLAPFSSMYLYGENAKNHFGDNVHPEVHDSDGVAVHTGKDNWLWRPLQQATQLQLYNFVDENPRGFGLIQRDRDFQHYQDLDARYNVRPSVWVTPHGNWGKGAVQLTQLVTNNTNTDNVVLFWRPDQLPKAGDRLDLDYTIDFYMNDSTRPPLAYCESTYLNLDPQPPTPPASQPPPPVTPLSAGTVTGKTSTTTSAPAAADPVPPPPVRKPTDTVPVQFLIDFIGRGIENLPGNSPPDLDVSADPPGTVVRDTKVEKNGYDNSWRVTFTVVPFKHHVPTELRATLFPHSAIQHVRDDIAQINNRLQRAQLANDNHTVRDLRQNILPQREKALQDAQGKPLSETWTYTWHQ